jgi:DNA-binding CsgD family transcriptional regulator
MGISASTLRVLLSRAASKVGAHDRAGLIRILRGFGIRKSSQRP